MVTMHRLSAAAVLAATLACSIGSSGGSDMNSDPARIAPFCDLMRHLDQGSLTPFSVMGDDPSEEQLVAAMRQSAQMYLDRGKEIENTVPAEVRNDVKAVLEAYRAYVDGSTAAFEGEAYLAASDRLDAWLEKNCGMVLTDPDDQ